MSQTFKTTCALDCPGACALVAHVADGRLVRLAGDRDHPFTQGVNCGKIARYAALQHGPRLTTPLLRDGPKGEGRFRPASWPEALTLVAQRLLAIREEQGGEAILPYYYGGTMGLVQRAAIERLTHRAGFSRLDRNICYSIGFAGWRAGVGKAVGPSPLEVVGSDLIILWGINAAATHITLMHHIKEARRQGARLVVVDPYRNQTARLADQHLAPRPGTDGALATAMMHVLLAEGYGDRDYLAQWTDFDPDMEAHLRQRPPEWAAPLTGLEAGVIREFARQFGRAHQPFVRIGLGMSRQRNGAVNVHAVSCLPAVTGAWQRGGGALFATGDAFPVRDNPVKQPQWMTRPTRVVDMSLLGEWLTAPPQGPPLQGLLVFNANPAASCPDSTRVLQGLRREDLFTVVHEQVMSDTARHADVLLPATTFLESTDLYKSYGQYTLQATHPVLAAPGEARCNNDVVNDLARAMGYDDPPFHWDSPRMVQEVLAFSGLPPLGAWPNRWLDFTPDQAQRHFLHGFPQTDGRFHFKPCWTDPAMPRYPDHWPVNSRDEVAPGGESALDFMTPPAAEVLNTTLSGVASVRAKRGKPRLWIHPQDAAVRGIREDAAVRVWNSSASLTLVARVTEAVRPGLCLCESNHPAADFPEGLPLNALTPACRVAPDGGPAFHDNRVFVEVVSTVF